MKMPREAIAFLFVVCLAVLATACDGGDGESTPTATPMPTPTSTPTVSRPELKLDDAPYYLDVSAVLPGFQQLDSREEEMSNEDLGLGPDFSEVVTYLSEEPFQWTFMFMYVASGEIEKARTRSELRDVKTLEEQFLVGFYEGVGTEEVETSVRWSDPTVGDAAKLARLTADFSGVETEIQAVIFLQEEGPEMALVFVLNLWYPFEPPKVDTVTIAQEISARIANR